MRHRAALFPAIVTATTAVLAVANPASAVIQGFEVRITEVPRTFSAGGAAGDVTVVASTNAKVGCQKVRWSMVMQVEGVTLDQVKVQRIENSADFPLQVQSDGDTARLTDARLDPGTLCRDRTVTAQYKVSIAAGSPDGEVRFQAEAFDVRSRLLERANATSKVVGEGGEAQAPSGQQDQTPDPEPSASDDDTGAGNSQDTEVGQQQDPDASNPDPEPSATSAVASVPASANSSPSLLGVGLIVGAILMFLGVGLLMRVRTRLRQRPEAETFTMPRAHARAFDPSP